jgi:hypothetical protein
MAPATSLPDDVLSSLLLAIRVSVAKLEVLAAQRESALQIERWALAKRCAREVTLVFEALDMAPSSSRIPLAKTGGDPLATLLSAYDRALGGKSIPRAVRALLEEHRSLLRGVSGNHALAA